MANWRKRIKQEFIRCDLCGERWNFAWKHQCFKCHKPIKATIPEVVVEHKIEWPQGSDIKSKAVADNINKMRQSGYGDEHPALSVLLEESKHLKQEIKQEKIDNKSFWAQQQSNSSRILAKQQKLEKQKTHLEELRNQRTQLDKNISEAQEAVDLATKEIAECEEEANQAISSPALAVNLSSFWSPSEEASNELQNQYKKLEGLQQQLIAGLTDLKKKAEDEANEKKQKMAADEAQRAAESQQPFNVFKPAAVPMQVESEEWSKDLDSETVKRVLAEHLAEGTEVDSVAQHLLTAMQAAKKRRTNG